MLNKHLNFIFFILRPLGFVYASLMKLRFFLYKKNIFSSTTFEVPVLSVGNLTMGGSGKTPMVIYIGNLLKRKGYKPGIVSRGYKGKSNKNVNIVSDGTSILMNSIEAGDEPRLIAETLPNTVVLTGKKRIYPCSYAVESLGCDALILDDGFQHLKVDRDIDLVLFNAADLYKHMHVFPGGLLREPFSALQRSSCFIITNTNSSNKGCVDSFSTFLKESFPTIPVFLSKYIPDHFKDRFDTVYPLEYVQTKVLCFSGIASPHRFTNVINELNIETTNSIVFPDHAQYTQKDVNKLEKEAMETGAKFLLTTEKDMVKLKEFQFSLDVYALSMKLVLDKEFDSFVINSLDLSVK